jgi:uncharacterized membrane protein
MKALKLIAWVSGIVAVIIMILGVIDLFFSWQLYTVHKPVNYFITANSFLLVAILCVLCHYTCECKEDKKK